MADLKQNAVQLIVVGLVFAGAAFVANAVLGDSRPRIAQMCSLGIVFGNAIFLAGCIQLARAKGHPWYVGLLGLLSLVGLAVLWLVVPDRRRAP